MRNKKERLEVAKKALEMKEKGIPTSFIIGDLDTSNTSLYAYIKEYKEEQEQKEFESGVLDVIEKELPIDDHGTEIVEVCIHHEDWRNEWLPSMSVKVEIPAGLEKEERQIVACMKAYHKTKAFIVE